ncbi:MAG: alpha/beta hydrolase [Neptuniibacter sp.]
MRRSFLTVLLSLSLCLSKIAFAEEVSLQHNNLQLNANLILAENNGYERIFLITHGTLAHNAMEIISSWQELLSDEGISSLAINLSLGLNNRHGMYECPVKHRHKHSDAADEIGLWANWLKEKGSKEIILAAHSRGGSQTVMFSNQNLMPEIKAQILIAPQATTENQHLESYKKRYNKDFAPILAKAKTMDANETLLNTDFIYCENTSVTAESFVSYYEYSSNFNTPALLQQTTLPSLVFIGSEDTTVAGLSRELAKISNENLQTMTVEGADHFFRDLYMDEVIEGTLEFLEGL